MSALPDLRALPEPGEFVKRPTARLFARVYPIKHPHYDWCVRVGFFRDSKKHYFKTQAEADLYAKRLNAPANLVREFRRFFPSDQETRAFLGIPEREPKAKKEKPTPEQELALTARALATDGRRYLMKNPFRVKSYKCNAKPDLKFVVRWKEGGSYKVKYFHTEGEAKTFADSRNMEITRHGVDALDLPAELRGMALRCNNELAAFGKTIADATAHFLAHLKQVKNSRQLSAVRDEFLTYMKGRGYCKGHLRELSRVSEWFMEFAGASTPICSVTRKQVLDFIGTLTGIGNSTKNHHLRRLSTWFNFARRNGYLKDVPTADVEKFRTIDKPPGVLTPDELERLLQAAQGTDFLPFLAIGAFAGLRVAELTRLDWKEVNFDEGFIEVTAAKSKTATRRIVKIQPCLAEWLATYSGRAGKVAPYPHDTAIYEERLAVCRKADAARNERQLADGARSLADNWPHNALRHSFASYHIAKFNDAAALALEMGHTTTAMIFMHYRQVVRPKAAELFWNIRPAVAANVTQFRPEIGVGSETSLNSANRIGA